MIFQVSFSSFYLIFFSILTIITRPTSSLSVSVPLSEMNGLEALYLQTNGTKWKWKNEQLYGLKWDFSTDPCNNNGITWQGIICSASPTACKLQVCHIVNLNLDGYGLIGKLPRNLSQLSFLTYLELSSSPLLVGPIPTSLGSLTNLRNLRLQSNSLTSRIPDELTNIKGMLNLYLYGNQLTGSIPSTLGSLKNLLNLYLNQNLLNGSLTSELVSFPNLLLLDLYENSLTGTIPTEIQTMSKLTQFYLAYNQFTGFIPTQIGCLTNLINLYLHYNLLSGSIPSQIQTLPNLRSIALYHNQINGSIPSSIVLLTNLQEIYLFSNQLSGTLPNGLGSLTKLTNLDLSFNALNGTIPTSIQSLTRLFSLSLNTNNFFGSIPDELFHLTALTQIFFYLNNFTGSIPPLIGSLNKLRDLYLNNNQFNGTLPSEIGSLTRLVRLGLSFNSFSGSIPNTIGSLTSLNSVAIYSNYFAGLIPPEIGSMGSLVYFYSFRNNFDGPIPTSMGLLTSLRYLDLSKNQLSQSIPSEIGLLDNLQYLYLGSNSLTSTIPPELSRLTNLVHFYVEINLLDGLIPSVLGEMSGLVDLYLNHNYFSGFIPMELIFQLTELLYLELSVNHLTGSIPVEISSLSKLFVLSLHDNYLMNSVPSSIGVLSHLTLLYLYENYFSGKISFQIQSLPHLEQLFLQTNHFTGTMESLFAIENISNISLINFDASTNHFSGNLPSKLFQFPYIETVALSSNCFHGHLPATICSGPDLSVISLDGLGAARNCPQAVVVPFSKISLGQTMKGTIPHCLWSKTKLQLLNLAGNGFRGSLGSIPSSSQLVNLTLAHNYLAGTIPQSLQTRDWIILDLSYNKLTGVCNFFPRYSNYSSQTEQTLNLNVNRLSGQLPHSFASYSKLNILSGNIFSCSSLPHKDENRHSYTCGSNEYDQAILVSMAIWLMILFVFLFSILLLTQFHLNQSVIIFQNFVQSIHSIRRYLFYSTDKEIIESSILSNTIRFERALSSITMFVIQLTLFSIFLSIPIYILKGFDYGPNSSPHSTPQYSTHSHMYRWFATVAFTSGQLPSGILLAMTTVLLGIFSYFMNRLDGTQDILNSRRDSHSSHNSKARILPLPPWKKIFVFISILFINVLIVGAVNGLYIWSTLKDFSANTHIKIQISLALFKFIWIFGFIPAIFPSSMKNSKEGIQFITYLNLINSVLIPCVVTAMTSPLCYQSLLVEPEKISSIYPFSFCQVFRIDLFTGVKQICLLSNNLYMNVIELVPPFTYSYECGSTLLTSYIPVYLYSYSFQIIGICFRSILFLCFHYSDFPSFIQRSLPGMVWPSHWKIDSTSPIIPSNIIQPYRIISPIMNSMMILLTFGLCSPILAVMITLAICLSTYKWLYYIGRYCITRLENKMNLIQDANDVNEENSIDKERQSRQSTLEIKQFESNPIRLLENEKQYDNSMRTDYFSSVSLEDVYLTTVEHSLGDTDGYYRGSVWPIVCTSSFFMTCLCWDMAGDHVGWQKALWVPIYGLGVLPFLLWLIQRYSQYLNRLRSERESSKMLSISA